MILWSRLSDVTRLVIAIAFGAVVAVVLAFAVNKRLPPLKVRCSKVVTSTREGESCVVTRCGEYGGMP